MRQADGAYFAAATTLTSTLLGPVASQIENKRLLIVAEGMLQYLPFAALPEPGAAKPLAVDYEPRDRHRSFGIGHDGSAPANREPQARPESGRHSRGSRFQFG